MPIPMVRSPKVNEPVFRDPLVGRPAGGGVGRREEFGQNFQSSGLRIEPEIGRRRQVLAKDDVLFQPGFALQVFDVGLEVVESVGIDDAVAGHQLPLRVLERRKEDVGFQGGVPVAQAIDAADEDASPRRNQMHRAAGRVDIPHPMNFMLGLSGIRPRRPRC